MADSSSLTVDPGKRVRLQLPAGRLKFLTKERFFRLLHAFARQRGWRLQVDGAVEAVETADGARFKVLPGEVEELPDVPTYGCPCETSAVLMARKIRRCGQAICCGVPVIEGDEITETAEELVVTSEGTVWEYRSGPLFTYSCTRVDTYQANPGGPAAATSGCEEDPQCGPGVSSGFGCGTTAPLCSGGPPAPGFWCYTTGASTTEYLNRCQYDGLLAAATAGMETVEDETFTEAAIEDMVGQSSVAEQSSDGGVAIEVEWEIKRVGRRIPVHLILVVRDTDMDPGTYTESEVIITLAADVTEGSYALDLPPEGHVYTIMSQEVIYGKLP